MLIAADLAPDVWPSFAALAASCGESEAIGYGLLLLAEDFPVRALDVLASGFGARVVETVGEA